MKHYNFNLVDLFNYYYLTQLLSDYKVTNLLENIIQVLTFSYELSHNILYFQNIKYAFIKTTQHAHK